MRDYYIEKINYFHDILEIVKDEHYDYSSISEYESVYADILDYEENEWEDFETDKELKEYLEYLKELIITGLDF